jgi:hypothetical protein
VHSIQELAELARMRLAQQGSAPGQPGVAGQAQPGWAAEPQAGALPGQPQQGWAAQPQTGPPPGPGGWRGSRSRVPDTSVGGDLVSGIGDDIAGAAVQAGMRFVGRALARGIGNKLNQALPAMLAKQQEMLQTQITIAERHPGIRACLADHVIFLDGGGSTLPMPNLNTLTVEQADALVAQLRNG